MIIHILLSLKISESSPSFISIKQSLITCFRALQIQNFKLKYIYFKKPKQNTLLVVSSIPDPNLWAPLVFGPPGSRSITVCTDQDPDPIPFFVGNQDYENKIIFSINFLAFYLPHTAKKTLIFHLEKRTRIRNLEFESVFQ